MFSSIGVANTIRFSCLISGLNFFVSIFVYPTLKILNSFALSSKALKNSLSA